MNLDNIKKGINQILLAPIVLEIQIHIWLEERQKKREVKK